MFVYILHFDTTLEHAQHYVGSTNQVQARLRAHACGNGARLTEVLIEKEIAWRLGGLLQTTTAHSRKVERQIKDQHNAHRFCEVCTEQPHKFPKAKRYPMAALPFPTDSGHLKASGIPREPITIKAGTTQDDIDYTISQMSLEKEPLGFIPRDGVRQAKDNDRLVIVLNNDDRVGYAIYTVTHNHQAAKIHQCCIQDDARMLDHGKCLVNAIAYKHPTSSINCRVRTDLSANFFWEAIGFSKIREHVHKTSKNILNCYHREAILSLTGKANPCTKSTIETP
jgi:predicted GIY-YIG superfamily endonuclease